MSYPSRFPSYCSLGERYRTPRALLHSSFNVPGIRSHFQVPQRGPYRERCPSPEPSFAHPPGSPEKKSPHQIPLTELPPFIHLSKSLANGPHPGSPQTAYSHVCLQAFTATETNKCFLGLTTASGASTQWSFPETEPVSKIMILRGGINESRSVIAFTT
jgi:hypothetical protein